jgi:hypothetical protein
LVGRLWSIWTVRGYHRKFLFLSSLVSSSMFRTNWKDLREATICQE